MPFEEQLPQWDAPGVEPPASKKSTGWQAGEKPPADYWNWQMNRTYKALEELQQKAAEIADLNAHTSATTGVHGATSAATPNTIVQRDASGRAKFAAPAASDDAARKAEVDAVQTNLNAHANTTTGVHGATSTATPNTLVQRDASGRFKAEAPAASDDVAIRDTVDNIPHALYRNAIINGNFDVWQRGTSFSQKGYTADRWVIEDDGGTPSYTVTRESFIPGQTDVPGEPRYYAKIAVSATSSGAIVFAQRVEDVRTFAGQKATLSFYARADVPTTGDQVASVMFQGFGTGGSEQVVISGASIALTTSWQRYSITFNVPSIAGKIIGQGSYLYVQPLRINPSAPLTNYYIAQVQLCAGDVALPFQPRSFAEELVLCQRYYEKSYDLDIAPGSTNTNGIIQFNSGVPTTNPIYIPVQFKVAKRIAPTVTLYDSAGAPGMVYKGANGKTASLSRVGVSGFIGGTADSTYHSDLVFHYTADAEL